ncbi:hypothetical protein M0802_016526 [Mischocyttarus mexicanus]|nr:hypothetical protein M0802_016526 [Mischocyttarus mexicanus]
MVIEIPSKKVGKLIGTEGKTIKDFQQKSMTKIYVDKSANNGNTAVTIIGSLENQNKAKRMIIEFLKDPPPVPKPCMKEDFSSYDNYVEPPPFTPAPIKKYFYKEDPSVAKLSLQEAIEIRKANSGIEVKCIYNNSSQNTLNFVPSPITTFNQAFRNYPEILKEIKKQGFRKPSPIQCQAWPILLSGKDMIGIAQTGTGKTLAFLLPALIHIKGQNNAPRIGPNALILAPTRELALQIEKEVSKYSYGDIKAICIYGGVNRNEQIRLVKKENPEIVIATPGRLMDLVRVNVIDLRSVSATWPPDVRRMALQFMMDPIEVSVGSLNLSAVRTVRQEVHIVDKCEKKELLKKFIREMLPDDKMIVFLRSKADVSDLSVEFILGGIDNECIHSGLIQSDREQAIEYMENGTVRILIATDLVSRGLDIKDITHVYNYDFPRDIEEYVHRVGRTGRAGKTGVSVTLMTKNDWSNAKDLIRILEEAGQEVPEKLRKMANSYAYNQANKKQNTRRNFRK